MDVALSRSFSMSSVPFPVLSGLVSGFQAVLTSVLNFLAYILSIIFSARDTSVSFAGGNTDKHSPSKEDLNPVNVDKQITTLSTETAAISVYQTTLLANPASQDL
jgi:hypothetical protein